jgi:hypothetical protein
MKIDLNAPLNSKKVIWVAVIIFVSLIFVGSAFLLDPVVHSPGSTHICGVNSYFWGTSYFGRTCVCFGDSRPGGLVLDAPAVTYCDGNGFSIENPLNLPAEIRNKVPNLIKIMVGN